MSLREQQDTPGYQLSVLKAPSGRWMVLLVSLGVVLLIAFYALTDGAHVDHDPLLETADWTAYAFCHRLTDRSFTVNGRPFPLCARCTGMYLGAMLAMLAIVLAGRWRRVLLPRRNLLLAMLGLIALLGIDGVNSYSHFFPDAPHLYEPQNWLRLVTGMGAGLTLGVIIFPALAQSLWRAPSYAPVVDGWREFGGLLLLGVITIALLLSNQDAIAYVLAIASTGGLLLVVTALNTAVLLIVLRRDAHATSWSQAMAPLLAGLVLAVVEISAISMARWSITGTISGFPGL